MGGGFGGSYSKSGSESSTTDVTPAAYANLRQPTANTLQWLMGGGPEYRGPFVANLTGNEQQGLDRIAGMTAGQSAAGSAARGEVERTLRGDYLTPGSNPFLADAIRSAQRSTIEAFNEDGLLQRSRFARAGQSLPDSSPFARAEAIRERGVADALGDVATRMSFNAYDSERGRQAGAVNQAVQIDQAELTRALEGLKAAALPRMIAQLGVDRGIEEFRRRVGLMLQAAGVAADVSTLFGNRSKSDSVSYSGQVTGGEA